MFHVISKNDMDSTTKPQLYAELRIKQSKFDLSQAFNLELVVTLHAQDSILVYTAETFLDHSKALLKGGIEFQHSSGLVPRGTLYENTGGGPNRPWMPKYFLILEPGIPKVIDIPFGATKPCTFDIPLWMNSSGFTAGELYEARLPSKHKISWWKWVSEGNTVQNSENPEINIDRWRHEMQDNVPILDEEEQLRIEVPENGVNFTCSGERLRRPARSK